MAKVETHDADADVITFDAPEKRKKKRDPNELPESMIERYGSEIKLSKKEQRRLQASSHSQKRPESGEEQKQAKPQIKVSNRWEEIYGATAGKMNDLISKQVQIVDEKAGRGGKKPRGGGRDSRGGRGDRGGRGGSQGDRGGRGRGRGAPADKRFKLGH